MKTILLLAPVLLSSFVFAQAQNVLQPNISAAAITSCIAPPSGLVGWWPGDNNENDIAGTNNPSAVSAVSLVPGQVLSGFNIPPRGEFLIPSSSSLANQSFTWMAWVRPDGPTLGSDKSNDAFGSVIISQNIDPSTDAVALTWRSVDSRFVFTFGVANSASGTVVSSDMFPPGRFYHAVVSYDGSVFRLFVNGALEGFLSLSKTVNYSSSGWTIGSNLPVYYLNGGQYTRAFNGVIDEVQAFNRALPTSELQGIYNAGSVGECKGGVAVSSGGVVSASAFGGFSSIAPGSWLEIYGSNLASTTRAWAGTDFNGANAPTSLSGTTVTIGGQSAFVDYVSPSQVNVQVPSNVALGAQPVTVTTTSGTSAAYTISVNATQPGLLAPSSFIVGGKQYVVALYSDGATYVLPPGAIAGVPSRRARPGDTIVLYGVGFGSVTPNIPAGQIAQQSNAVVNPLQVFIGGAPAILSYAGLAPGYVGLYQLNLIVPNLPANDSTPVTFTLGGIAGPQTLYMAVQN